MLYCIYEITNKINGKTYIGQHRYKNNRSNDRYLGSGVIIAKAVKAHGVSNFEKRIIIDNLVSRKEADSLEKMYIRLYREHGMAEYNIANGGHGSAGFRHTEESRIKMSNDRKGRKWSDQAKERLSKTITGRKVSDEQKMKISKANKGKPNYNKGGTISEKHKELLRIANTGKRHSEETRRKISVAQKGKRTGAENHASRPVICVETGVEYESIRIATGYFCGNKDSAAIYKNLTGRNKSAFGYHFRYK